MSIIFIFLFTNSYCYLLFIVLQLLMLQPAVVLQETDPPSLKALVCDPYIIIAAGKYY